MLGLFDTGHGGLTVVQSLQKRLPGLPFVYFGDHANAPYGGLNSKEILRLTRIGVEALFNQGCRLVVLACNTATAYAARPLQQDWLPSSSYKNHNVLGIIAPTVEAATQTPWAVTTPQVPQALNEDTIAVFGTAGTIQSGVYDIEIRKRCPKVRVFSEICPHLAGAIEAGESDAVLEDQVKAVVENLLRQVPNPSSAILGCTHYPLVEGFFRKYLPPATALLSQSEAVAASLSDYIARHPHYIKGDAPQTSRFLTSGDVAKVCAGAARFLKREIAFETLSPSPLGEG
jgi:glutamate racemase